MADSDRDSDRDSAAPDLADFDAIGQRARALGEQIQQVIVGQQPTAEALLLALLCRGHVLLVGVPGLAKTLLVRALSRSLDLSFKRIQFTPDMMPSDILGTELLHDDPDTGKREFRFAPGPVFAQLILADEINRTPPRTQAALLEAMAERQVTVAGRTMVLDEPFFVVATQNPIEQEGTYPLPEAQLDRFMFSLWMDYPQRDEEREIAARTRQPSLDEVRAVYGAAELVRDMGLIERMPVAASVVDYAVDLVRATRPDDVRAPAAVRDYVEWGAGPRAAQALVHAAQAAAAIAGEPTPRIEHVRHVALPVLRHRVLLNFAAADEQLDVPGLIESLLSDAGS